MAFAYEVQLTLINPETSISLRSYEPDIRSAVIFFNNESAHTRNPKHLELLEVSQTFITLTLKSAVELPAPAKALRLFSQYLLAHSGISAYTYHNSLFKSLRVTRLPTATPTSRTLERDVMDIITQLLTGEQPNRSDFFSVFQTLFQASADMNDVCRAQFLKRVKTLIAQEAETLGHTLPSSDA